DKILLLTAPTLSPDGNKLAVVASVVLGQALIVVMNVDGSGAEVASANDRLVTGIPAWSPDGTKIAYVARADIDAPDVDVFVTDLAAHTTKRLVVGAGSEISAIRWSPDGNSVCYTRRVGTTDGLPGNPIAELIRADGTSGATQTVA